MGDLWHSWGKSPRMKAREKEYNSWYYRNHKEEILNNARKRKFRDSQATGRDYNPNNSMDSVRSHVNQWGNKEYDTKYNEYASRQAKNGTKEYLEEFIANQRKNQYPDKKTAAQIARENREQELRRAKWDADDVVENLPKTLLTSPAISAAAALGITLVRKILKRTGNW